MWITVPTAMLALALANVMTLGNPGTLTRYQLLPSPGPVFLIYGLLILFSLWVVDNAAKQRRLVCVRALQADLRYHFILHRDGASRG